MTTLYLATDQDGQMFAHRNRPAGRDVKTVEIDQDFGTALFYGEEFLSGDTFISPLQSELVLWANGRGPVEISIITAGN